MVQENNDNRLPSNRRDFIVAGVGSVTAAAAGTFISAAASAADSSTSPNAGLHSTVKALVFDVFGTVVDWRGSIIREGEQLGKRKGINADWVAFADAWRGGYQPAMQRVRSGQIAWTNIDGLNRIILNDLAASVQHQRAVRRRDRSFQPRVASVVALAGFGRGIAALEVALCHIDPVERQRGAAHQHGEVCRIALGLYFVRGAVRPLQARPRGLSGCRQAARTCTIAGDDDCRAHGRSDRGEESWACARRWSRVRSSSDPNEKRTLRKTAKASPM